MADRRSGGTSKRCTIYYDGASRGNPGRAGAGAVIRSADGRTYRVREGLGTKTNNAAEYLALNRGLQVALNYGFEHATVRGDSELVHRQIIGEYETRNPYLKQLQSETFRLMDQFESVNSEHVLRAYNSDADALANEGVNLREGEVLIDSY